MKVSILGEYTVIKLDPAAGDSKSGEVSILGRTPEILREHAKALRERALRCLRESMLADGAAKALLSGATEPPDPCATVRCTVCGGLRVQLAMWVNPNTMEVVDDFGSWGEDDTRWCDVCEDHCELTSGGVS